MTHEELDSNTDVGSCVLSDQERAFASWLLSSASVLDIPSEQARQRALQRLHQSRGPGRLRQHARTMAFAAVALAMAAAAALWIQATTGTATGPPIGPEAPLVAVQSRPLPVDNFGPIATEGRLIEPSAHRTSEIIANGKNPQISPPARFATPIETAPGAGHKTVATSQGIVIWDGDRYGLRASGWTAPKNDPKALTVLADVGVDHSRGLVWRADGKDWIGFGWNWFSWFPENAGTNIAGFRWFVFTLRVVAASAAECPSPSSLSVALSSSRGTGKRLTRSVPLEPWGAAHLCDGEWHRMRVPLDELLNEAESQGFDQTKAWEFLMGQWSADRRLFTLYIDDVGFEP